MPDRGRKAQVPDEIREAVGDALTPENLEAWWEARTRWFNGGSPRTAWEEGRRDEVMNFITAAKSGDMS
jgi:hypothetical protein